MKHQIQNIELENAIADAVNLIHQLGNELVAIHNGDDSVLPGDADIAAARAVGISNQKHDIAMRLHRAFHGPPRRAVSPLVEN